MVRITFVEHDGTRTEVDAAVGQSVMKAAVAVGVPGIAADCGGSLACGTCRIYAGEEWQALFPAPREGEVEMLEFAGDPRPGVRLSCQIPVTEAMEGMVLDLPERQHY